MIKLAVARLALLAATCSALGACSDSGADPDPNPNPDPDPDPDPLPESLGRVWTPTASEPAVSGVPCPSLTCVGLSDPSIVRAADGALLAWFTSGGVVLEGDTPVLFGPHIVHARRARDGEPFVLEPEPVVEAAPIGAWDRHVETVTVVRDPGGEGYQMFYMGYEAQPGDSNFIAGGFPYQRTAIGRMGPLDAEGRQWQRQPEPIYRPEPDGWDGVFVTGTSVLIGPDGVWRLYYSGAGTTVGVGLLTSNDGVTWEPSPDNPVFERELGAWDEATIEPTVRYFGGKYWMWYAGYVEPLGDDTRIAIGLATSDDGVHWQREPDNPVLEPGATGTWNDLRVLSPEVLVEEDGSLLMAAYGCNERSQCREGEMAVGLWQSR